jgi:transcriptional regulator with XRE-family HTH domain
MTQSLPDKSAKITLADATRLIQVSQIDICCFIADTLGVADELNAHLGLVVRRIRRSRKLTQEQLADRVGLTRTSVTNIELGSQGVSVALLVDLARGMDADPVEILAQALQMADEASAGSATVPAEITEGVASSELRDWVLGVVQREESGGPSSDKDADEHSLSGGDSLRRRSPDATVRSGTGGRG